MGGFTPCAGNCLHGACINGTCVCDKGWSGNADLLTGDLTPWGGPVLDCDTHLKTMSIMWSIVLGLCMIAIIVLPVTMYQQWQNYMLLRTPGSRKQWFQHRPLLYVLGHAAAVVAIFTAAILKVATPDFQRVVGIDRSLTMCFAFVYIFGVPISYVFLLDMLATFTGGIRSEMAPNPWLQSFLVVARLVFALSAFVNSCIGVYTLAAMCVPPLSGRHIHELCDRLVCLHMAVANLLVAMSSVVLAAEILRNINHTVRERTILAKWTRSADLQASVKKLRWTRLKVAALETTIIVSGILVSGISMWIASDISRQMYGSYVVAYVAAAYMQVVLLVLQTYTTFNIPLRQRVLEFCGLKRLAGRSGTASSGRSVVAPSCKGSEAGAAPRRVPIAATEKETSGRSVTRLSSPEPPLGSAERVQPCRQQGALGASAVRALEAMQVEVTIATAVENAEGRSEVAGGAASSIRRQHQQQTQPHLQPQPLRDGSRPDWDC